VNLYEYQAKKIFGDYEIKDGYRTLGSNEVVLNAQTQVGGRGKSGGIKIARSSEESAHIFRELIGMHIKSSPVSKVLIEEKVDIRNEYYVGITIDPTACKPILLMSSSKFSSLHSKFPNR
jgi:succinyl-CoA synthetase beta subunit